MSKKMLYFMSLTILLCSVGVIDAGLSSVFEDAIAADSVKDFAGALHDNPILHDAPEYCARLLDLSKKQVVELAEALESSNQVDHISKQKGVGDVLVAAMLGGMSNVETLESEKQIDRSLIKEGFGELIGSMICGIILGRAAYEYYMDPIALEDGILCTIKKSGFVFVPLLFTEWLAKRGSEHIRNGLNYKRYINTRLNNQYEIQRLIKIQNNDIIEHASYYIIAGNEQSILDGISSDSTHVTFYTADGDEIIKLSKKECDLYNVEKKLDPAASKPKVATWAIKYLEIMHKTGPRYGYHVVLKDKHGNYIDSFCYDQRTKEISVGATGIYMYPEPPSWYPAEDIFTVRMSRKGCTVTSVYDLKDFDMSNCVEQDSDPIEDHSVRTRKKHK